MTRVSVSVVAVALLGLLVWACSDDDNDAILADDSQEQYPMIISASVAVDEPTRITLHDDGRSLFWDLDDSLSVFISSASQNCATVYGEPNGRFADFVVSGDIVMEGDTCEDGTPYTNLALYPYDRQAELAGVNVIRTTFAQDQEGVVNSVPDNAPMVAVADNAFDDDFPFRNVSSFIRLSLTSEQSVTISRVVLTSLDVPIAGPSEISVYSDKAPTMKVLGNGSYSITLYVNGLEIGREPVVVFMALPPVSFDAGGWSIRVVDDNYGYMDVSLPAFTFERNKYYTLPLVYEREVAE